MTAGPDGNGEPEPIELPPPKRTLLGRLAHWVEHAQALKGWVQEARGDSPALDATFETIERDSHIGGGMLAGALSYRLFIFALPLAFFLVSGLGVLASALGVQRTSSSTRSASPGPSRSRYRARPRAPRAGGSPSPHCSCSPT